MSRRREESCSCFHRRRLPPCSPVSSPRSLDRELDREDRSGRQQRQRQQDAQQGDELERGWWLLMWTSRTRSLSLSSCPWCGVCAGVHRDRGTRTPEEGTGLSLRYSSFKCCWKGGAVARDVVSRSSSAAFYEPAHASFAWLLVCRGGTPCVVRGALCGGG